jgi:UPF0716 protein FxsA
MRRLLFLVFLIVPIIEIALFITIGNAIGIWPTLLGILVTALAGAVLLRTQGMSLLREIQQTVARGGLPGRAIAEAMLVGIAGVLLLTPGYFTDLLGILLLIPPVRGAIYGALARRFTIVTPGPARSSGPRTIDLEDDSWRHR